MALRIALIICSVVAAASAGFTFAGFDRNGRAVTGISPGFGDNQPYVQQPAPQFLPLPGFANFPNFPNFPQIHMSGFQFPNIHIPSPDEIVNVHPEPGQTFNGISVSSDDRGTRVITNKDGKVHKFTVGDDDNKPTQNEVPPKPKYTGKNLHKTPKMPKFHKFPKFEMPEMKPMKFLTPDDIRKRVPGKDEQFVGYSKSTFASSSTVNGKTKSVGGSESIVNKNGAVKQESVRVAGGDED